MKMRTEKHWKMISTIEFCKSKLGYLAKFFDPFCKTFLTNRDKNEDEDKKISKNEFDFSILDIKTRLYKNFHENLRKQFLTHSLSHF